MIVLDAINKTYPLGKERTVAALRDINLTVDQGEYIVITGRSGSGKTTLLNVVAGLTRPTSGKVLLDDVDLLALPDQEQSLLRNQQMGFIFQFPSLIPSLNSLENVALPTMFGTPEGREGAYERAEELLAQVGLADKLEAHPRQLSAGQQQRVVVARALINQPPVLLADEPTSNLDERTEQEIMHLLQEIHARTNITVLLVTHTAELVSYGTRSLRMTDGRLSGSTS
jgi:ABC-type lipoprotein export system ATPase subunit